MDFNKPILFKSSKIRELPLIKSMKKIIYTFYVKLQNFLFKNSPTFLILHSKYLKDESVFSEPYIHFFIFLYQKSVQLILLGLILIFVVLCSI